MPLFRDDVVHFTLGRETAYGFDAGQFYMHVLGPK